LSSFDGQPQANALLMQAPFLALPLLFTVYTQRRDRMKLFLVVGQKTAGQCSIVAARSKRDAINKITRLEGVEDAWAIRIEEFMITFKMEENTAFFQPDLDRAVMSMNIANQKGSRGRIFRLKGDVIMKKRKAANETAITIH
jgi:hypothetical protein